MTVLYTTFEDDGTTVFDPTDRAVRYRFGAPETVENGGGARPVHGGTLKTYTKKNTTLSCYTSQLNNGVR